MVKKKEKERSTTYSILFKDLIRNILSNWKQYFSIVAISLLSICLFGGLTSNANNLKERQDYLYGETNYADVYVNTTSLDDTDREYISNLDTVSSLEERIYFPAKFSNKSIYLIGTQSNPQLSKPMYIKGNEGLAIMASYAKYTNTNVGDHIQISLTNYLLTSLPNILESINNSELYDIAIDLIKEYFPDLDLSNIENGLTLEELKNILAGLTRPGKTNALFEDNLTLDFLVTGIMYHPEGVQNSQFNNSIVSVSFGYLANSLTKLINDNYNLGIIGEFINDLLIKIVPSLSNQILVMSSDIDSFISSVNSYFSSKEDNNLIIVNRKESFACYQALKLDVTQANQLTFVFPIIFFLVSLLVILTTLSQMIIKARSNIGILKAIGVKRYQIYLHYILIGTILCFVGGLLGFILGPIIIPKVMGIKYNLLWDLPSLPINFFYGMSILLLFSLAIVAGLCSFFVSYSVIKEKPVDTLRPKQAKIKKRQGKDNSLYSKFSSVNFRLAMRNIFKNKGKSIMVILGMLGCTALMVCGFGIADTLHYDVDNDLNNNRVVDVMVTPNNMSDDLYNIVSSYDGVERCERVVSYPVSVSTSTSLDTVLNLLEENSLTFKPPYNVNNGATIDQATAEKLDIGINDTIKILINGKIYQRQITHIFQSSILHGIYDMAKYYPDQTFVATSFYVTMKENADQEKFKQYLLDLVDENNSPYFSSVQTSKDILDQANNLMSSIELMTDVIKIFAILLCIVVIYNLTSLNISERMRDIATLKVLGFRFYEISKTLTYEIALDSLIGSLLGLLLGYPLMILVLVVNITDLFTFIYYINWYTYVIGFVISFATSLIVSILLNFKAKKIDMAESLKSVD